MTTPTNKLKKIGGLTEPQPMTPETHKILAKGRPMIQEKTGREFTKFEPTLYSTQLVAGVNYFFKILVDENEYIHARLFKSLPHTGSEISCHSVKTNLSEEDPLEHF